MAGAYGLSRPSLTLVRRPLTDADRAALPWFVLARSLWFMGLMAGRTPEMGSEALGRGFFEFGVNFMTGWEKERGEREQG